MADIDPGSNSLPIIYIHFSKELCFVILNRFVPFRGTQRLWSSPHSVHHKASRSASKLHSGSAGLWSHFDVLFWRRQIHRCKAHETRTRNSWELTCATNLYVCHTDLQQDISRASFSHQIERVLFRASSCASFWCEFLVWVSCASVMGLSWNTETAGFLVAIYRQLF